MLKESSNSAENLAATGRHASRGNLISTNANMDDILDKLKCLNYTRDFCKPGNFSPLHRYYFAAPSSNPNEQFFCFTSLFAWLLKRLGQKFETPGQFDDPNATCANIGELKKIGIPFEYGPARLKQGYGEGILYALQAVVDHVIQETQFVFKAPIQRQDEYPEEAQLDLDAEVTTEAVEEDIAPNFDGDSTFMDSLLTKNPAVDGTQSMVQPLADPSVWRAEVERVTPLLKIQLANNNKDWRIHIQQLSHYQKKITQLMNGSQVQLERIHSDIQSTLEQISSREKYINSQFEALTDQYRSINDQSSDLKQKYTSTSSNVTNLTNELSKVSEDLDKVKSRMDELGSGMTDSKPLTLIKQGLGKIKGEIKQMDMRTGVIEHTLLHAKMQTTGAIANNGAFYYS